MDTAGIDCREPFMHFGTSWEIVENQDLLPPHQVRFDMKLCTYSNMGTQKLSSILL